MFRRQAQVELRLAWTIYSESLSKTNKTKTISSNCLWMDKANSMVIEYKHLPRGNGAGLTPLHLIVILLLVGSRGIMSSGQLQLHSETESKWISMVYIRSQPSLQNNTSPPKKTHHDTLGGRGRQISVSSKPAQSI